MGAKNHCVIMPDGEYLELHLFGPPVDREQPTVI